jgi:hypothetical protein
MTLFARLHRDLEPADTLGELIFGLIMVLTFTLGARLLGPDEPIAGMEILIAAIGCNIAWGVIDAFLFLLGRLFERRRMESVMNFLRCDHAEAAKLAVVRNELDGDFTLVAHAEARERFYASIAAVAATVPPVAVRLTAKDVRSAGLVFALVVATAIPAALPFLFVRDGYLALRLSNAVLAGLLFVAGYQWGRYIGAPPPLAGFLVMSIGVALVLLAIPLGG